MSDGVPIAASNSGRLVMLMVVMVVVVVVRV